MSYENDILFRAFSNSNEIENSNMEFFILLLLFCMREH